MNLAKTLHVQPPCGFQNTQNGKIWEPNGYNGENHQAEEASLDCSGDRSVRRVAADELRFGRAGRALRFSAQRWETNYRVFLWVVFMLQSLNAQRFFTKKEHKS